MRYPAKAVIVLLLLLLVLLLLPYLRQPQQLSAMQID